MTDRLTDRPTKSQKRAVSLRVGIQKWVEEASGRADEAFERSNGNKWTGQCLERNTKVEVRERFISEDCGKEYRSKGGLIIRRN